MKSTRTRLEQLEAQRAAADQARTELLHQTYEEVSGTFAALFERVLGALDLTAAQHEQARALLVDELTALKASKEQQ